MKRLLRAAHRNALIRAIDGQLWMKSDWTHCVYATVVFREEHPSYSSYYDATQPIHDVAHFFPLQVHLICSSRILDFGFARFLNSIRIRSSPAF